MKRTMFITMLAAALMGGQVFADYIPTTTDAAIPGDHSYAGVYSETEDVSGANVTINEEEDGGEDLSEYSIYGGRSREGSADGNTVTMTGGQVSEVNGGKGGTAYNNTVTISGGQVFLVVAGSSKNGNANNTVIMTGGSATMVQGCALTDAGEAVGNNVYIAGGEVVAGVVGATADFDSGVATNNRVHLVGAGSSVTVGGATYAGQAMQLGIVYAAMAGGTMTGNSIEVYGTEITAATLGGTQMVNFHIADGVLLSQEAMVSLTSTKTSDALNLTGVEIGFNAADVQDWGKYEGQTITLVTAAQAITIDQGSLGDVEIKDANGTTVATATLALGGSDDVLTLSNIKGATPVPEPTSGTLSLLALAALAARRRKHN
ncbi:MAG: hypothetical protein Q4E43_08380 [Akkermansia sp.]|nr:hypothetical protein [Akkermansia sp.]